MHSNGLKPEFSPLGVFAFSIGASIGWGSFVVTCSTYLMKSGLLGTVGGLLIGMSVMLLIAWNLQYMIQQQPGPGGAYIFQKNVSGHDLGFVVFWFIFLVYLAILWANLTAVPLFVRFFLGDTFQFGFHYEILHYDVWFGEALLSMAATLLIGLLCASDARVTSRVMSVSVLTFIAGFVLCTGVAVLNHDSSFNYAPIFTDDSDALAHIVRIAAISPWAFIGFECIAHFSGEYDFPVKKVRGILIASVIVTTALYLLVSLLSVSAYPPEYDSWLAYLRDMEHLNGIKAVPAFYVANHYLGNVGIAVLLLALFSVILTSLIANSLSLSRLLYAAGRAKDAPEYLGKLNAKGVPSNAIFAIVAISLFVPFVGRTAIGWIVDVTTLGATLAYWLISHGVYLHARREKRKAEQYSGLAGMVIMSLILLLLLVPGLLPFHAMETESYALFIVWSLLGLGYFTVLQRMDKENHYGKSVIVWMILLMLVLFASLMWASRETETMTDEVVTRVYQYQHSRLGLEATSASPQDTAFLHQQAEHISNTNALYTLFSLILFLCFSGVLLYKDHKKEEADAAERKRIISATERDRVTSLYHWNYFLVYISRLERKEQLMDAAILNIERFRSINSLHGREFGDRVLKALGSLLERFSDETGGLASRSEADYFGIYCPHREDWQEVLERFQAQLNSEFPDSTIHLRMGVMPGQPDIGPVVQFDCARTASKKFRGTYISQAVIFDKEMWQREDRDQHLLNDLTRALENGELSVYYQPKYDITGDQPKLSSAEALVRWKHPELGLISPGIFIPLFERTGRIVDLDTYVWKQAARQIADWRDRLGITLPVSVNLSRVDVFAPNLTSTLEEIIAQNSLNAADLKLEVTESAYTDNPEQLIQVLRQLRDKGYQCEMDDFGSGYSSLNMLSTLPIDILKMDIAFIRNIERNEKDSRLVSLVVDIARSLNLPVVAEGVETQGQLDLLRKAGCNLVQGYYFSRPLPADEFEQKILSGTSSKSNPSVS